MNRTMQKVVIEGMKFELGRVSIEVTGDRSAGNQLDSVVVDQVRKLMSPVTTTLDTATNPQRVLPLDSPSSPPVVVQGPVRGKVPRTRTKTVSPPGMAELESTWKPDVTRWGTPLKSWTIMLKACWVLNAYLKEQGKKELTTTAIANIFNNHFTEAGQIRSSWIMRDFKKKKDGPDALVAHNSNSGMWCLTDVGQKFVEAKSTN